MEFWTLDMALCSWERSGEDTGSSEEIGAFLSTGDGDGERDFPNGEEGREPHREGLVGEGGTFTTVPKTDSGRGGLTSSGSSSNTASLLGLGVGTGDGRGFLGDGARGRERGLEGG